MTTAVDNDVLYKALAYDLVEDLLPPPTEVAVLGVAKFVLNKMIQRDSATRDVAAEQLTRLLEVVEIIEPSPEEKQMAAELELLALRKAVGLDVGESQLCAAVVLREMEALVTGDKRAIFTIEVLLNHDDRLEPLIGTIICLEQLVLRALPKVDPAALRKAICTKPEVDKALSICFSCGLESTAIDSVRQGLDSYINAIREKAGRILSSQASS